ncbi:MAG TPA: bifunctional metallophosphatase/5'-nucleotidase, partial [Planctomycetaceae bacterium]|nr:bifunctional metallophosphatase/5'-nucleotidase [Planctomycetaceae bacterium]
MSPTASAQLLTDAELAATAAVIQTEVDALKAANPDLNKIILTSHMQVFDYEETLAAQLKDVDVIIAGGSEPVTGDANDVPREGDVKTEEYPTWVTNAGGTQT